METGEPQTQRSFTIKPYHPPPPKHPSDYDPPPWKRGGTHLKFDQQPSPFPPAPANWPVSAPAPTPAPNQAPLPAPLPAARPSPEESRPATGTSTRSTFSEPRKESSDPPPPSSASSLTPQPGETDRSYAARRLAECQTQVACLRADADAHVAVLTRLDAEIEDVQRAENALHRRKEEEIAQAVREINARYSREAERLGDRVRHLVAQKEGEVGALRRNARAVEKGEVKMRSLQTLMELDDDSS